MPRGHFPLVPYDNATPEYAVRMIEWLNEWMRGERTNQQHQKNAMNNKKNKNKKNNTEIPQ